MVRASDSRRKKSRVRFPAVSLSCNNLGQVVHTHVPLHPRYNLVPVKGWWCPAAGKVTVGPSSHYWPYVAVVYPPTGSRLRKGYDTPRGIRSTFTLGLGLVRGVDARGGEGRG